jgi:glycosyltransferase involved in cell wall biosynthesis
LRILHTEASLGWGGQEIRVLTEAQVFMKNGHEVFLATDVKSQIAKKANAYGVKVIPINLKKKSLNDLFALRRVIKDIKPDVINCHSSTDHWLSAIARLTLKAKPAIVRTRHISTHVHRNKPTKWLYNNGTDAIMTTGQSIRAQFLDDNFVNEKTIFSVPTGIDTNRFSPGDKLKQKTLLGLSPEHFVFGIIATLRSWKGHADLIAAFDLLNNPNITLVIVGDGPQMENCIKLAQSSPYSNNIKIVGEKSDVVPYLQAFDCFVLPSYANEGIPQALLQAMSVGLPIISCPIGGIPEAIEGYEQATLVATKNPKELAGAMTKELVRDRKNSKQARQTLYSLERMYQSVLDVFNLASEKVVNSR